MSAGFAPPRGAGLLRASAVCGLFLSMACVPATPVASAAPLEDDAFKRYWFSGQAELTRYRLEQARYGEIHQGHAVLIFVTEDFLPDKQVKADAPDRASTGAVPVLKLNATKKFNTGIYPYSVMTSSFSPLDLAAYPHALKTTTSVQEWCGHTFLQLNLRGDRYQVRGFSYFESEGDRELSLRRSWLEDEIWTRIRLDPGSLPTGRVSIIPGGEASRLLHFEPTVVEARAALNAGADGERKYTLEFPGSRSLSIRFAAEAPHEILGWTETVPGRDGDPLTTRAERTHSIQTDYWDLNGTDDAEWRSRLGLD